MFRTSALALAPTSLPFDIWCPIVDTMGLPGFQREGSKGQRVNLETPWQRIAVLGAWLAFLAILAIAAAWTVSSLSEANAKALGDWIDVHSAGIWGFVIGAIPAVATYLFGQKSGKSSGKTEAFNSAVAAAKGLKSGDEAAQAVTDLAAGHGIRVKT